MIYESPSEKKILIILGYKVTIYSDSN